MKQPLQRRSKNTLIFSLIFYPITLAGALYFFGFVLIVFYGVGSVVADQTLPWRIIIVLLMIYPVLILVCLLIAWRRYRQEQYRSAFIITLLPLLDIPVIFLMAVVAFNVG